MDDPYRVLGVRPDADDAEIKKAYRRLAKELHPDLHPNDAKVAERFKRVSRAYDLLRNKKKRIRYDRGEIDGHGNERVRPRTYRRYYSSADDSRESGRRFGLDGFQAFGLDAEELFGDFFGGARGVRGQAGVDRRVRVTIDFLDAARGCKRRIQPSDGKSLVVDIPAGIEDGKAIRLKGQGEPGRRRVRAGDLLVEIEVRPHPILRRDGNDVRMELPISFAEAVLGARIDVPTIDGPVTLSVPKGTRGNQVMRLKGRGIKAIGAETAGDQLVRLVVVMPEKPDESLIRFAAQWSKEHAHDPRAKSKSKA